MKQLLPVFALLTIVPGMVSAQTPTRERLSSDQSARTDSNAVRTRVVGPKVSNRADSQNSRPVPNPDAARISKTETQVNSQPAWGNTSVIVRPEQTSLVGASRNNAPSAAAEARLARKLEQPPVLAVDKRAFTANSRVATTSRSSAPASLYNIGIGDVLDIRLSNMPARESTLFTVLKNGTVEYPLLSGPLAVSGLTTDEIANLLATQIKVITAPKVNVSVRDYASHSIVISGLVDSPGRKTLRREAMPLYALLAQALVRPEGTTATIVHGGKDGPPLSLKDDRAMATLISSGDVIKISAGDRAANQYVYVGGNVASPGEKSFRQGLTLTQVLLLSGADPASSRVVKVARRNRDGFLSTSEYNLRSIEQGKTPDPLIEPGDRIEVARAM